MSSDSEPIFVGNSAAESDSSSVVFMNQAEECTESFTVGLASLNDDPPVIVGAACRLPGDITTPSGLWDFMVAEKSAQGPVIPERYNIGGFYHPNGSRSGSSNVPGGYFINEDLRRFDNGFFGINNLEATYMDPQQRKLLELVYECLESSGTPMNSLSGSLTGVYVGNFSVDYQPNQTRDPDYIHRYTSSGSGATIMSNRISHVLNLHGPSFTIDTACSSSIYALHQALNAMRVGDCDSAIVASANMVLSPELHIMAAKSGVLSPTGTCHTFDASADGYGRAEAVNAIYIKRLSAALRDGNPIRAVIRGSAVNASGRTPGISLPSGEQQEAVIRKAYYNAGLNFSETDYVECHGTGTPVGDPIEVNAIGKCFAPREGAPLLIGSVKSNVGHSEGASGLTSILKVVTAFENGKIPPSQGVVKLNPKLILKERNIKVATAVEEWPRSIRRASINSFGYGGANAHLILESAESYLGQAILQRSITVNGITSDEQKLLVLPVSASTTSSLEARVKQISQAVSEHNDLETLRNLAHTLTNGRDDLRHRGFLLAHAGGKIEPVDETATTKSINTLPFGFVFTGQGAQYAGMAKELLIQNEHFRNTIRTLDLVLKNLPAPYAPDWTLEQTLLDGPSVSRINEVTRSQPICTAVQIGLVDLLRTWGIQPSSVVGHSSGEIGAAYAAGLLSLSQAILVAYYRGYAVGTMRSKGSMIAAGLNVEAANQLIEDKGFSAHVRVACVNSPDSVTIAGSSEGIEAIRAELVSQNKFARKLETGGRAYHSHMMEEIGPLYQQLLTPLFNEHEKTGAQAEAKMYSSVGFSAEGLRILDSSTNMAAYWRQNLEQPVQFSAALSSLAAGGKVHLIEIGPHAALKGPIKQIRTSLGLDTTALPYSSTLTRNQDADVCMKNLAGGLFTYGHTLSWSRINGLPESGLKILHNLLPYPWDYTAGILWSEPRSSLEQRNRKHIRHELLGTVALTGNDIDFTWRNLLKPSEMPWIQDHKLEDQVVFPGAAYLAMAAEGVSQIKGVRGKPAAQLAFEFQNVSITAALHVPDENDAAAADLELHTTMTPRKRSGGSSSVDWYDFSISSWRSGETKTHCTGSVRLAEPVTSTGDDSITVQNTEHYDDWQASRWYKQWAEEGFCFGPHFQSLIRFRADNSLTRREAIGTVNLVPALNGGGDTDYPVHPITIDAAIQAAIWSTTAGKLRTLKAWFPVFISECRIQPSQDSDTEFEAEIHTRSEETGVSSRMMAATLRDGRGAPVVAFKNARIALFTGKKVEPADENSPLDIFMRRQPTLRVNWKPDVLRLGADAGAPLKAHISAFVGGQHPDLQDDAALAVVSALLDLAGHKNPRMRVLELGGDALGYKARQWLGVLDKETAFPRCRSWHSGAVDEDGEYSIEDGGDDGPYDVLLVPTHATSKQIWAQAPERTAALVSEKGIVITRKSDAAIDVLTTVGFDVIDAGKQVLLAVRPLQTTSFHGRNVFIVHNEKPSPTILEFANALAAYLHKTAGVLKPKVMALHHIEKTDIAKDDICVSLLEMEREFLATISPQDTDNLKAMTDVVTDILWVTGANMLGTSPDPNLTLASGLSRALMLEQPALRYSIFDVGPAELLGANVLAACEHALKILVAAGEKDDTEFILSNGILHVSRFGPDVGINALFRRRAEPGSPVEKQPLANSYPSRVAVGRVGAPDTIHFQQLSERAGTPPAGHVDIRVVAASLGARDASALLGRADSRDGTTASELSGVVAAVGAGVLHVKAGDRVVAHAPHQLGTSVRLLAESVQVLADHEEFNVVPTLLSSYSTALYALNHRAHLTAGESILVHEGADAVGIAAITLAQRLGATVYATADSQPKREYLFQKLGVPASHIFSSTDPSVSQAVAKQTGGRGVDVILNSLPAGALLPQQDTWRCLAEFGRFVEVGRREVDDAGRLDMRASLRNATFTTFDLADLYYAREPSNRAVWDRLLVETLDLYRAGATRSAPAKVFDVAAVAQAYQHFAGGNELESKVIISFDNPQARIPVMPAPYLTLFNPEKVYLLIGCLGGLGRSLSRWMMARGARRFVFLGRSGTDKPSARQLVSRLENAGGIVGVVRGDVSKAADVTAAVKACIDMQRPIGGVIQAAMGLHEALFTRMSNEAWHTGIDPKWQGTWNLHNSLDGHDNELDFFLLTSSVSGTVGTATESNYCAANGFLDTFARWRRSQGKPAVSIGLGMISEVGYLHENPEIEALLLRKGIQPLNEEEMLQIVDLALSTEAVHDPKEAHLLTGLEPANIRALGAQGYDVSTHGVLVEARASILLGSLQAEKELRESGSGGSSAQDTSVAAAPWFKDVPAPLTASFAPVADAETMKAAILTLIKKRFSNLILMPFDQIDDGKPLPGFGVDSMIASEFRTWYWTVFRVDVPFLDLMSAQKSLSILAEYVEAKIAGR